MKKILTLLIFLLMVSPLYALDLDSSMAKGTYDADLNGVVDTATALAANGANCSAGQYPLGVDASGAVESCTANITVKAVDFIPVGYMIDGTVAPAAKATLTSTNTVDTRAFDGAANEDLDFVWVAPFDFSGTTILFRVLGYVSNATAPANTEVIAFSLACNSLGNSEILSTAVGDAQTSSLTADATYVQYDRLATAYSAAITPSGTPAAGESFHCDLTRLATTTDTYAQDFDVAGVEIKYSRALTND